jgi:hypothetical protein
MLMATRVTVNGEDFGLLDGQDIAQLKRRFEAAAEPPGRFVEFTAFDGRELSVLITPAARVLFSTYPDAAEADDPDAEENPYPADFDW